MTDLMSPSEREIGIWKKNIETIHGRDRLQRRIASLCLTRDFDETVEHYLARRGLQQFYNWAITILRR